MLCKYLIFLLIYISQSLLIFSILNTTRFCLAHTDVGVCLPGNNPVDKANTSYQEKGEIEVTEPL